MSENQTMLLFEGDGRLIRRQWVNDRWYFSVVDVVAVLTDSVDPGAYWRKLKQRLLETEGANETVTNCHVLKMRALDGKLRATDAADTETLLRIIQSIPSPKAEPFKRWLAKVDAERIEEVDQSDLMAGFSDEQKRLFLRGQVADWNTQLSETARVGGVASGRDFAVFQDWGYRGLYDGEKARDIAARKGLSKGQHILDYMGSTELAANHFRITQTDEQLRLHEVREKDEANRTHFKVGQKVRKAIADIGGAKPEHLPAPDESIQELQRREQQRLEAERQPSPWLDSDVQSMDTNPEE
jgi:DNA-damage-inducible protein D